jgi:hypothetical protein
MLLSELQTNDAFTIVGFTNDSPRVAKIKDMGLDVGFSGTVTDKEKSLTLTINNEIRVHPPESRIITVEKTQ